MGRTVVALLAIAVVLWMPRPASAWGFAGHRLIMQRAIDLLPPELKPMFERNRTELVVRVVDPDTWRNVGWEDDPNHFLDYGAPEYGKAPFAALPRDYNAALEKFGMVVLKRNGLLPWRAAEQFGNLRRGFEEFKRTAPYTISNTILYAAVTSHYVQDAHQPFHATDNYDGQLTGQHGLHSRFERDLVERFGDRLRLTPAPPRAPANLRDFMFDTLIESNALTEQLLKADKEALGGRDTYDAAYFESFFAKVQPLLEQQLSKAISATAGVIVAAWEQAGRPALRLDDARPVERVRGPR